MAPVRTIRQANLPLTQATFFILLSLSPGRKHGYAILKDVQALSRNRVVLSTGTLYGSLKRLLEQGWIVRVEEPGAPPSARERKAYALTDLGRRALGIETERLANLVQVARRRSARVQA
jgi:DNA-binding PadR family transcriptional regulator